MEPVHDTKSSTGTERSHELTGLSWGIFFLKSRTVQAFNLGVWLLGAEGGSQNHESGRITPPSFFVSFNWVVACWAQREGRVNRKAQSVFRCRDNPEHTRQPRPDSGLGFQRKILICFDGLRAERGSDESESAFCLPRLRG